MFLIQQGTVLSDDVGDSYWVEAWGPIEVLGLIQDRARPKRFGHGLRSSDECCCCVGLMLGLDKPNIELGRTVDLASKSKPCFFFLFSFLLHTFHGFLGICVRLFGRIGRDIPSLTTALEIIILETKYFLYQISFISLIYFAGLVRISITIATLFRNKKLTENPNVAKYRKLQNPNSYIN